MDFDILTGQCHSEMYPGKQFDLMGQQEGHLRELIWKKTLYDMCDFINNIQFWPSVEGSIWNYSLDSVISPRALQK